MGNCLKSQSSCRYDSDDDEDWDFSADKGSFGAVSATTMEVKIKISKKQLEELLSKVDVRDLKVEQVLSQLMDHSGGFQALQRPWRPALQSIPED
ncbi:uncharacterized protein LOC114188839 [Vigna unguiculata]|uniref:Uncharacterized protein n=1 Tax=Vigna unguiculata TaxID=3917 RepID=A0A4D6KT42_VIGUN|nr:uncharacterized protein LOC114188839 [Vigna unguiculata]QCD78319.1 hypothetical protein DEO72_LG1g1951 [Vigna unguiculata]